MSRRDPPPPVGLEGGRWALVRGPWRRRARRTSVGRGARARRCRAGVSPMNPRALARGWTGRPFAPKRSRAIRRQGRAVLVVGAEGPPWPGRGKKAPSPGARELQPRDRPRGLPVTRREGRRSGAGRPCARAVSRHAGQQPLSDRSRRGEVSRSPRPRRRGTRCALGPFGDRHVARLHHLARAISRSVLPAASRCRSGGTVTLKTRLDRPRGSPRACSCAAPADERCPSMSKRKVAAGGQRIRFGCRR